MAIEIGSGITIGGGVSIDVGAYSFTLTSADISTGYGGYANWNGNSYPAAEGTNGVDGFTLTFYPGQPDWINKVGNIPYQCNINSQAIADFFNNLVAQGIISSANGTLAVWDVTWGPGSTSPTGAVVMSGTNNSSGTLYICTVDPAIPGWDTYPPNSYNTVALPGTWLFPATFTLRQPAVDKGGWC